MQTFVYPTIMILAALVPAGVTLALIKFAIGDDV